MSQEEGALILLLGARVDVVAAAQGAAARGPRVVAAIGAAPLAVGGREVEALPPLRLVVRAVLPDGGFVRAPRVVLVYEGAALFSATPNTID